MESLIVIVVSIIAVVLTAAEGQNFHTEPGELDVPTDEAKLIFPGGSDFTDFIQHEENRRQERKNNKTSCKPKTICVLLGGSCVTNAKLCSGRLIQGCKGKKCQCCVPDILGAKFENLEQELQSMKSNLSSEIQSLKYNSLTMNLNLSSEIQYLTDNSQTMNSNLSSELQSLKENTQNMSSELQFFRDNTHNINSNLSSDIQSIKDNTQSMNLNLSSELQFLKDNTKNMNLNLSSELHYLKDNSQTMNSNFSSELQSLKDNTHTMNFNLSSKLSDIDSNLNSKLSNVNSSIHSRFSSLAMNKGCPLNQSYFQAPGTKQCFKLIKSPEKLWSDAKSDCESQGLVLAKVDDPLVIRKYIVDIYGLNDNTWIDARGDGSKFVWQRDGVAISNTSPLWYNGHPGSSYTTSHCLSLATSTSWLSSYPNQTFYQQHCSTTATEPYLCEYILGAKYGNLEAELQSMKSNLSSGIQSLHDNTQNMNFNLSSKLSDIDTKLSNVNSSIQSKLASLEHRGCPVNQSWYFMAPGTNQCFKYMKSPQKNWNDAKSDCESQGLVLAKVNDPLFVRRYMISKFALGNYDNTLINAKGDGSKYVWQVDGVAISNTSPLWYPGQPGSVYSTSQCLTLGTVESWLNNYPNQPFYRQSCTAITDPYLCELILG